MTVTVFREIILEGRSFFMAKKWYLVYEKQTPAELAVGCFPTVTACARFLGVSREHAHRIINGTYAHPTYGIYVDEVDE